MSFLCNMPRLSILANLCSKNTTMPFFPLKKLFCQ